MRGTGTNGAGNALRMKGGLGLHQFAHLEESYVKVGQRVKRGHKLAKMGHTGYTIPDGEAGAHLHYWLLLHNGSYVYPPTLYTDKFIRGDEMAADKLTRAEVKLYYMTAYRVREPQVNQDFVKAFTGKTLQSMEQFVWQDPSYKREFKKTNSPPATAGYEAVTETLYKKKG